MAFELAMHRKYLAKRATMPMGAMTKKNSTPKTILEFKEASNVPSFNHIRYGPRSIYGLNNAIKDIGIMSVNTQPLNADPGWRKYGRTPKITTNPNDNTKANLRKLDFEYDLKDDLI